MKNKLKITRRVITIVALCVVFLTACVNLEEDVSAARLDPANLTSLEGLEASVVGAYKQVGLSVKWAQFWINSFGADDLTTHSGKNKISFREADRRTLTSASGRINTAWEESYKVIKSVNNIIENKDNFEGKESDRVAINSLIGEAYFLRGLYYFNLTQTFGEVPLNLTIEIDPDLGKSEISEIYTQIESDFLNAESLLPVKYPGVNAAIRPNSGSARAFLAKLYLHWAGWPLKDSGKYALAASSAKTVIDNAGAHGFALVPDMNTLWSIADENRLNSEIVFAVAHCVDCGNSYANRHTGKLGYASSVGGWNEVFAEIAFLEDFPEGPRKDATYVLEGKLKKDDSDGIHKKGDIVNWTIFDDEAHPSFKKVTGLLEEIPTGNSSTSMTTYFMRYADLLLIYAEAEGRSGGSSVEAWEALNKVRRRAYGNSNVDLSTGDLAELAFTERKWELAGEFIRWGDLVRMERVANALANRSTNELVGPVEGDTSPANYFSPIPQSEIDRAPQLSN
ncbi:RagB/SusD family nutrient uptake outer membrane protein [Maribacter sp.]|uniref:RagB/SusD family nutrient uptake outer membrane protein n=1 Tax=Maribacter sp. TaxID=1897614 RepID=UPI0025BF6390|nr:RagB/SusD family nutrient uptake outer membrane protein [Maribacter sp.]